MCVGREGELHARTRSSRRGVAKYAGTRRTREWSAEIRPLALQGRCFLLVVFVFGYLAFKSTRYGILIGFFGYLAFKSTRYGILIGFLNFRNGS